jgi:hypothetical protein
MDKRTKILMDEFNPATEDGRTWDADLQLAITLNPDITKIKKAMDEHAKQVCLEFIEYMVKETTGHSIDKEGDAEFKYGDAWISKEELFENFL